MFTRLNAKRTSMRSWMTSPSRACLPMPSRRNIFFRITQRPTMRNILRPKRMQLSKNLQHCIFVQLTWHLICGLILSPSRANLFKCFCIKDNGRRPPVQSHEGSASIGHESKIYIGLCLYDTCSKLYCWIGPPRPFSDSHPKSLARSCSSQTQVLIRYLWNFFVRCIWHELHFIFK